MGQRRQFIPFHSIPEERAILRPWQEQLFFILVRLALVLGGLAAIPGIIAGIVHAKYSVVAVDVLAYGLIVVVALVRPRNYRASAILFIAAVVAIGTVLLFEVGLEGASMIWLFAPMVLVPLLLSGNALLWISLIMAVILGIGTTAMVAGVLAWELSILPWLTVLASYAAVSVFAVGSVRYLLRHLATALVNERRLNAELRIASDRNQNLLSEIHHRVQNSLQLVLSMLSLERTREISAEVMTAYDALERRVMAMALVYTGLRADEGRLMVQCRDLIDHMCRHGDQVLGRRVGYAIEPSVDAMDLPLEQATPIALFLGELLRLHSQLHPGCDIDLTFSMRSNEDSSAFRIEWNGSVDDVHHDSLLHVLTLQLRAVLMDAGAGRCRADMRLRSPN